MVKLHVPLVRKKTKTVVAEEMWQRQLSWAWSPSPSPPFHSKTAQQKRRWTDLDQKFYLSAVKLVHQIMVYQSLPQLKSHDSSYDKLWIPCFCIFALSELMIFCSFCNQQDWALPLKQDWDFHPFTGTPQLIKKLPINLIWTHERNTGKELPTACYCSVTTLKPHFFSLVTTKRRRRLLLQATTALRCTPSASVPAPEMPTWNRCTQRVMQWKMTVKPEHRPSYWGTKQAQNFFKALYGFIYLQPLFTVICTES